VGSQSPCLSIAVLTGRHGFADPEQPAMQAPPSAIDSREGLIIPSFSIQNLMQRYVRDGSIGGATPHTVTDLKALRAIVKQVRDRGYAVVEEEFAVGGTGIAAPIFDGRGAIFAVLDAGWVSKRFPAKRTRIIREPVAAPNTLSHLLTTKADDQYASEHQHQ
jgi:IclR family pca regulon transcriptional regulator